MGIFNWAEAPHAGTESYTPDLQSSSSSHRSESSNDELIEMRQRQIAEAMLKKMETNLPRRMNSDKAGLIEDARRKHYEDQQHLRSHQRALFENRRHSTASGYGVNHRLQNLVGSEYSNGPDQIETSGTELNEAVSVADNRVQARIFKPFPEEPLTYNSNVQDNAEGTLAVHPSRGDTGTIDSADRYSEIYEMIPDQSLNPTELGVKDRSAVLDVESSQHRALFSPEKAGQVQETIRRFLHPHPSVVVRTEYVPATVPTYYSNLVPKVTFKPPTAKPTSTPYIFRPTARPTVRPPTRSPVMETNGDKAAQTEEALYQQYLQAEHLRRIIEYERERLEWEQSRELQRRIMLAEAQRDSDRRSAVQEEDSKATENEYVQKPEEVRFFFNTSDSDLDYANRMAVLESVDHEWLSQLSPDLQARYLEEVLTSRRKESDESQHAEDFMRRHLDSFNSTSNTTFPNVSTRTSVTGHVTTIIQSKNAATPNSTDPGSKKADISCLQSRSDRRLFIRAPKLPQAFVYRYERKKHSYYPFRPYLVAEYRCRRGFNLLSSEQNQLFCRRMEWVGMKPQCVRAN